MAEKLLHRDYIYRGRIVTLRLDRVELENGHQTTREIIEHPGAVVIVALDDAQRVLLVRQHRQAVEQELVELPAGLRDKAGESAEEAARRELEEETGFRARQWEHLIRMYSSPGILAEAMEIWMARDLEPANPAPEEDEVLGVILLPFTEALAQIGSGEIVDGKTIVGLLWAARKLGL